MAHLTHDACAIASAALFIALSFVLAGSILRVHEHLIQSAVNVVLPHTITSP